MKSTIEKFENYSILKLSGQFVGGDETDRLFDTVKSVIETNHKKIILDFADVTYFSSIVIGRLIRANREFVENDGHIVVCNLNHTLKEIFGITKVATIIKISENIEEAIKKIETL